MTVVDLLRKYNISQGTFYRWKRAYIGMQVNVLKRLKKLEKENARLKKLVKSAAKGSAVEYVLESNSVGITRICGLICISRSCYRYQSRRADGSQQRTTIREKAQERKL